MQISSPLSTLKTNGYPGKRSPLANRTRPDPPKSWLIARGLTPQKETKPKNKKKKKYAHNIPVLKLRTKCEQRHIKLKEARDLYGFVSETVFTSPSLKDETRVEDYIQSHFQYLPLGHRLWCCTAKGKSADEDDIPNNCVYKVFIAPVRNSDDAPQHSCKCI
jgi:hypothetical protein